MTTSRRGSLVSLNGTVNGTIACTCRAASQQHQQHQQHQHRQLLSVSSDASNQWQIIGNGRDGFMEIRECYGWIEVRYTDDGFNGVSLARYITSGHSRVVTRHWSDADRLGVLTYLEDSERRSRQDLMSGHTSSVWRHQSLVITSGVHRLVTARLGNTTIALDVLFAPLRYTFAVWCTPVKLAYHVMKCNRKAIINDLTMQTARNALLLERVIVAGTRYVDVGQSYSVDNRGGATTVQPSSSCMISTPSGMVSHNNVILPNGNVSGTATPTNRSTPIHHQRSMSNVSSLMGGSAINASPSSSIASSTSLRSHPLSALTNHRSSSGTGSGSNGSAAIGQGGMIANLPPIVPGSIAPSSSLTSFTSLRSHSRSPSLTSMSSMSSSSSSAGRRMSTTSGTHHAPAGHRSRDSYGSSSSLSSATSTFNSSPESSSEAEL